MYSDVRRGAAPAGAWLAVAAWVVVILSLGGDPLSLEQTSLLLEPLLAWLFPDLSAEGLYVVQLALRKTAHVTEYGVLAWLSLRALRRSVDWHRGGLLATSLALVLAVAISDESRQAGSQVRTGSAADVAIDALGGALALAIAVGARRRRAQAGAGF